MTVKLAGPVGVSPVVSLIGFNPMAVSWLLMCATPALPQVEEGDDTGTNPINFTWDWRAYVEMQDVPEGDNSLTMMTIEQRVPINKSMNFRFRVRHVSLSLDPQSDGTSTEVSGLGDWDARVTYVPSVGARGAIAVGLEATFNTATNRLLGSGKTTLGPQVFGVLWSPPGGGALISPAYRYVFDIAGDDDRGTVSRSQIDIFYLWLAKSKKWWVLADPQGLIDHESETGYALFEAAYGRMMFAGLSSYVRPSIGIGNDRPYEWSAELGFKVIYR